MQRSFNFVNVSGKLNPRNKEYKHNVRVQSMKAFRRHERFQRKQQVDSHEISTSDSGSIGRGHDNAWTNLNADDMVLINRQTPEGIIDLDSSLMDPFLTTALPFTLERQMLVRTFIKDIDRVLLPTPCSNDFNGTSWTVTWMQQALSSPLLLCAICSHASTYRDIFARKGTSVLTLQVLQETFGLLQQALREKLGMASDEMIGAVVLLIANTFITGNREDLASHNLALRDMLAVRGGCVRGTPYGDVLDQTLGWHIAPTTLLLQEPVKREGTHFLDLVAKPAASHLISPRGLPNLVDSFHQLVHEFNKLEVEGKTTAELTAFSDARVAFEYSIVQYWDALSSAQNHPLETTSFANRDIEEAMCVSLLIKSLSQLRKYTMRAPSVKSGLHILIKILQRIDVDSVEQWNASDLDSLLWVTSVATSGKLSTDAENMVIHLTRRATDALESRTDRLTSSEKY